RDGRGGHHLLGEQITCLTDQCQRDLGAADVDGHDRSHAGHRTARGSAAPGHGPYDGPVADFSSALPELDHDLAQIEAVVDVESKRAEIAELEQEVAAPDLWDD